MSSPNWQLKNKNWTSLIRSIKSFWRKSNCSKLSSGWRKGSPKLFSVKVQCQGRCASWMPISSSFWRKGIIADMHGAMIPSSKLWNSGKTNLEYQYKKTVEMMKISQVHSWVSCYWAPNGAKHCTRATVHRMRTDQWSHWSPVAADSAVDF